MAQRGDGIGVEVGDDALRGVRIDFAVPGRVAAAADEPVSGPGDDGVLDAFVRLRARLGGPDGVATWLAWFPGGTVLRAVDVTGLGAPTVRQRAGELAGVTAATVVGAGARQWLVGVSWDERRADRLVALATQAGLAVTACEPAPLALARVLPAAPLVTRRRGGGWDAVLVEGVPRVAVSTGVATRSKVGLLAAELSPSDLAGLAALPGDGDALVLVVTDLARQRLKRHTPEVGLVVMGEVYPSYSSTDERAAARQAVALGAAVGAAGLGGRVRAVEPLAPVAAGVVGERMPWVVERLVDVEAAGEPSRRRWWRRLVDMIRRVRS